MATNQEGFRISTLAGTQYLGPDQKKVWIRIAEGSYRQIDRSELQSGDIIVFRRSEARLGSLNDPELQPHLRESPAYKRTENIVFVESDQRVARLTDLLVRGVAARISDDTFLTEFLSRFDGQTQTYYRNGAQQIIHASTNGELEDKILGVGNSQERFSAQANGFMAQLIFSHLGINPDYIPGGMEGRTHYIGYETVQDWLLNECYTPADWNLFSFLAEVNPEFQRYYESFQNRFENKTRQERHADLYTNVMFYRYFRSVIMNHFGINPSDNDNNGGESTGLNIRNEIDIVLSSLVVRIDEDLIGVKVTGIDKFREDERQETNERETKGILTEDDSDLARSLQRVRNINYYSDYAILTFALSKAYDRYFQRTETPEQFTDQFLMDLSHEINSYLQDPSRYGADFWAKYYKDASRHCGQLTKDRYEALVLQVIEAIETKEIDTTIRVSEGTCLKAIETLDYIASHEPTEYKQYMHVKQAFMSLDSGQSVPPSLRRGFTGVRWNKPKQALRTVGADLEVCLERMKATLHYNLKKDAPTYFEGLTNLVIEGVDLSNISPSFQTAPPLTGPGSEMDPYVCVGQNGEHYARSKINDCLNKYGLSDLIRVTRSRPTLLHSNLPV